jgi:glycosyltransferase involved in cell wall biosynthesis
VGLDTRNLALAEGTGVASYARNLALAYANLGFTPQWLEAEPETVGRLQRFRRALGGQVRLGPAFAAPDIFRVAQVHFNLYGRAMRLHLNNPPRLMHWTYPLPLYLTGSVNIVTIHDLIPLQRPELTGIDPHRMRRLLREAVRNAEAIVTVSETVRVGIIAELGVAPARVFNLYQAVDVTGGAAAKEICPPGSFLVIGSVETRKNIARLVAAHAASGVANPLVIVGPDMDAPMTGALRLPYAKRPDLLRAMASARAILLPSLAEGFGLPIAEGFALGVPVMTSRGGATEEVAGGAALLVDPLDVADMAVAIRRLARDDDLCARLQAAGLARSPVFGLDAFSARLGACLDQLLKSPAIH